MMKSIPGQRPKKHPLSHMDRGRKIRGTTSGSPSPHGQGPHGVALTLPRAIGRTRTPLLPQRVRKVCSKAYSQADSPLLAPNRRLSARAPLATLPFQRFALYSIRRPTKCQPINSNFPDFIMIPAYQGTVAGSGGHPPSGRRYSSPPAPYPGGCAGGGYNTQALPDGGRRTHLREI